MFDQSAGELAGRLDPAERAFIRARVAVPLKAHFYHAVKAALGRSSSVTPEAREKALSFLDLSCLSHEASWIFDIRNPGELTRRARQSLSLAMEDGEDIVFPHEYCVDVSERAFSALDLRYGGRRIALCLQS